METIIITLLGINLYLFVDYILDNYYFNGTKTKEGLILNRHLYYEFIQIVLLVVMIFIQISLLPELPWTLWLFPILFIILWASRIQATYNNWACEIRIEKEKVIFIDNEGKENTIELPSYFSIQKEEGDRFSLSSKSLDYILRVRNKKGEELKVNLSENSLDSYVTQIYKSIIKNFPKAKFEGIQPGKYLNLKNLSISLLVLLIVAYILHLV